MPTCPECGAEVTRQDLIKEWDATKKGSRIKVTIHYWQCPDCKRKFRTATRTWPEGVKD